ncbi:MAG: DUF4920 domain-containing protein [Rudanella sp.]|nr:DUF4920 domain-containing protein [Rudanella sp.]
MKYTLILALSLGLAVAANAQSVHGKKISEDGAVPAPELVAKLGDKPEMTTKVQGTVASVCKVKGCWMEVKTDEGKTMRVTFKDYGFFVPKDIAGKQVVFEGVAQQTTTSVADLKHYAEDAGKSKAEIAKITEPEKALTFVADGVIVK